MIRKTATQEHQERRIRWQHGLRASLARLIAELHYGGAA